MGNTYWNIKGKHQNEYYELWARLVPAEGPAATKAGEALRAVTRLYFRWFNDGDRVTPTMSKWDVDGSAARAFSYLYQLRAEGLAAKELMEAVVEAATEEDYELALENALDAVIEWALGQPDTPNEDDFLSSEFDGAYDFDIEEDEDEDDDC